MLRRMLKCCADIVPSFPWCSSRFRSRTCATWGRAPSAVRRSFDRVSSPSVVKHADRWRINGLDVARCLQEMLPLSRLQGAPIPHASSKIELGPRNRLLLHFLVLQRLIKNSHKKFRKEVSTDPGGIEPPTHQLRVLLVLKNTSSVRRPCAKARRSA
eukprot:1727697-Rhodomonas_salina.2